VDIRISARAEAGRSAVELADDAEAEVRAVLGTYVWASGDTTWSGALAEALAVHGWTLATAESGTDGALVGLLRGLGAVRRSEVASIPETGADKEPYRDLAEADRVRAAAEADVGLAIRASAAGDDTAVNVAVVTPERRHAERRLAFLRGSAGADRAAIAGAAVLLAVLRNET
jgi:hypothetical protein